MKMKVVSAKVITPLLLSAICILTACSPKTSEATLPLEQTNSFSESGNFELPDRWWTVFEDSTLNSMVDTALTYNFNLLTAWQRLGAAQALIDFESAAFLPSLEASFNRGISQFQFDFEQSQRFRLGLSSAYEVDLWGASSQE